MVIRVKGRALKKYSAFVSSARSVDITHLTVHAPERLSNCACVAAADPLILLGNRIDRVELLEVDGSSRYMLNAERIWQLADIDPQEQTARFVAEHEHPESYIFCARGDLGRLELSDTSAEGAVLHVDAALLRILLLDSNGLVLPIRPALPTLEEAMTDATLRHPSGHQRLQKQRIQGKITQAANELSLLKSATTADADETDTCGVLKMGKSGHRIFQGMLIILMLALGGVLAVLLVSWFGMAQHGIEQPGHNFLTWLSLRAEALTAQILLPAQVEAALI